MPPQFAWWAIGVALMIALKEKPSSDGNPWKAIAKTVTDRKSVELLVARHETLVQLTAYLFFLVCIKVIKYTDLNRSMTIVYLSVGRVNKRLYYKLSNYYNRGLYVHDP